MVIYWSRCWNRLTRKSDIKISKQEWKRKVRQSEQLDTVMARSIMIETLFIAMRYISSPKIIDK